MESILFSNVWSSSKSVLEVFYKRLHLLGNLDFWENIGIQIAQLALPTAIQQTVEHFPCWGCNRSEPEQLMQIYCRRVPERFVGANPIQNAQFLLCLKNFALLKVNEVKGKTKSHWFWVTLRYQKPSCLYQPMQGQLWNVHIPTTNSHFFFTPW